MPNHIMNRITCENPAVIAALMDGGQVDFNRVIPKPAIVPDVSVPLHVEQAARSMLPVSEMNMTVEDQGLALRFRESHEATGHMHGLSWKRHYWGTKWNAYDAVRRGACEVQFETAWSAPFPVVSALVKMFPNEDIRHTWSDEDWGNNLGYCDYADGKVLWYSDDTVMSQSRALEFAAMLRPYILDECVRWDGTTSEYVSVDD